MKSETNSRLALREVDTLMTRKVVLTVMCGNMINSNTYSSNTDCRDCNKFIESNVERTEEAKLACGSVTILGIILECKDAPERTCPGLVGVSVDSEAAVGGKGRPTGTTGFSAGREMIRERKKEATKNEGPS
jgi:hypothetical protein